MYIYFDDNQVNNTASNKVSINHQTLINYTFKVFELLDAHIIILEIKENAKLGVNLLWQNFFFSGDDN